MKKTEKFDYLLFAGSTKNDLYPTCAYKSKEDAIEAAKRVQAEKLPHFKCLEVILMPEDNDDINEVVWSNCGRK